MNTEFVPPEHLSKAFNCPNCRVYAKQMWAYMAAAALESGYGAQYENKKFTISRCESCDFPTIWHGEKIVYPLISAAEPPNLDLPAEIKADFEEARSIASRSPRGAAALLRLCIQKICVHLGQPGTNINSDIKALVAAGLPAKVQEALDSVRVIGNEAVHPGSMDLKDDIATANHLFKLVNFIANKMVTEPKEIEGLYNSLPQEKLNGISQRDSEPDA